jgi:enhancing lycopene biosynthesis protein 2
MSAGTNRTETAASTTDSTKAKRVAVVLCGCGRGDGSEIHESVSVLIALAQHGASYRCFAPDRDQAEVVNHLTGAVVQGEKRNCLVEAARIARGAISPLSELREGDFDAVVFPGGFGAAKNLCSFAKQGEQMTVSDDVAAVIRAFHSAGKAIGLVCIAPVMGAKVLGTRAGGPGCEVTIGIENGPGGKGGVSSAIESWGSVSVPKPVEQAHVDTKRKVYSAPAYMDDGATPAQVFAGISAMVKAMIGH